MFTEVVFVCLLNKSSIVQTTAFGPFTSTCFCEWVHVIFQRVFSLVSFVDQTMNTHSCAKVKQSEKKVLYCVTEVVIKINYDHMELIVLI